MEIVYDKSIVKEKIAEIASEVSKIIESSKATFFVNEKNKDAEIPPDELLYELKAEISNNVGMYFSKLLNQE